MTRTRCEHLDDYLLKELPAQEERAFQDHLAGCEACRIAVEQNARIDRLLKVQAEAIPCPAGLMPQIRRDWQRQSHRQRARIGSLLAAGLVIGLLGWSILSHLSPEKTPPNDPVAAESLPAPNSISPLVPNESPSEIADVKPASPVRVEFPDEILGLPIDTGEPDITLIQLFPVTSVSETSP